MRPLYETPKDKARALSVAVTLAGAWGYRTCTPTPDLHVADFILQDHVSGVGPAIVEVKCRTNRKDAYPTYMLSKAKYDRLLELCADNPGTSAVLIVSWADAVGACILPAEHTVGRGGRWDRGDARDVEPIVYIPISAFHTRRPK